jgi:phosphate:Na+ symporter
MSGVVLALHLAGAVALLIWATRMVRTGVERAFGSKLQRFARFMLTSRLTSALAGFLLAAGMQSSTAAALLVAAFTSSGVVAAGFALAAMLGADLGSAVVAKVLTFNLSLLVPVFLVAGTAAFLGSSRREWRQAGRIAFGLGLILLSLRLIGEASEPLREGGATVAVLTYLRSDPLTAFFAAAAFAWLVHSSIATILLIAALAARGMIAPELGVTLVLGANLGGSLIAFLLTRGMTLEARLAPVGNLVFRGTMAAIALLALQWSIVPIDTLGSTDVARIINFHVLFNASLLVFLPFTPAATGLARRVLASWQPVPEPDPLVIADGSALDPKLVDKPAQALAGAAREVLRLGEMIEFMLRRVFVLYDGAEKPEIQQLKAADDRVDAAHSRIKLYLARIDRRTLDSVEAARREELLDACIRLEQVGDIIVHSMLALVQKKQQYGIDFSADGRSELAELHARVLANAQLALNILASRDRDSAIQLMHEKESLRDLEIQSRQRHIERLAEGSSTSMQSSTIHLDTVRDLKQINSLLASIAYPVLEEAGLLRRSRMTTAKPAQRPAAPSREAGARQKNFRERRPARKLR